MHAYMTILLSLVESISGKASGCLEDDSHGRETPWAVEWHTSSASQGPVDIYRLPLALCTPVQPEVSAT